MVSCFSSRDLKERHLLVGLAFQILVGLGVQASLVPLPTLQDQPYLAYPGKKSLIQLHYVETELNVQYVTDRLMVEKLRLNVDRPSVPWGQLHRWTLLDPGKW